MGNTWPHLFLYMFNAKNAKNGISIKYLDLGSCIHEPLYIWYQCRQGIILRMSVRPYPICVHLRPKKKTKSSTYANLILVCLFVCLFGNYSQTIKPKGLHFSWFDEGHPEDVIRKFGEDQSETLAEGLFFFHKVS